MSVQVLKDYGHISSVSDVRKKLIEGLEDCYAELDVNAIEASVG